MRALIVGASGELGRAVSRRMFEEGYSLVVHGFASSEALQELVSTLPDAESCVADIRDEEAVKALVAKSTANGDLQVIVYAAGRNFLATTIAETPLDGWNDIVSVNLTGAFLVTREALPFLKTNRGRIVIVSSIFGIEAPVNRGAYASSKHGLAGLVQTVAKEEGEWININGVCPGPMWTENVRKIFVKHAHARDMTVEEYTKERMQTIPAGRFCTLEECADAIAYLASEKASFINGEMVRVTGGSPT